MPLDRRLRAAFYFAAAVLFFTGTAWFVLSSLTDPFSPGSSWPELSTVLLMAHGGMAMLFLLLLGAIVALHVPRTWRPRRSRGIGAILLGSNAILIGTAFGLYYFGSEALRRWTSDLHTIVGLAWPLLLVLHVIVGVFARRR